MDHGTVVSRLLLLLTVLVQFLVICAIRPVMRPEDFLTLLPPSKSGSARGLRNPVDVLPEYVGALVPGTVLNWTGTCFGKTSGYVTIEEDNKESAILHLEMGSPMSWLCMDLYAFATPYRLTGDYFFFSGHHRSKLTWLHPAERKFVLRRGLSVFLMPKGFLGSLQGLWDVLPMLSNSWVGEAAQIAFLKRHMKAEFVLRKGPWETELNEEALSHLHSGDLLLQSKMRGLWGCFETLQKWASGSWSGHSAMVMRDEEDRIFVAESGHYNEEGEPVIAVLPFSEWYEGQKADTADPHLAVLPLHSHFRAHFNHTAAWKYVRGMDGQRFGYHNIIFSWIDTKEDNFPPPLTSHLVAALASMWIRIQPDYANNLWKEALNQRLGTNGLEFPTILAECDRRGMSFGELLAIPERDEWVYSDGVSTSCVAFVLSTWKAAGIFGSLTPLIQATEFTIRDAYNLQIFEDDKKKLPPWCNSPTPTDVDDADTTPEEDREAGRLPYCQIRGKWRFDLPGFNSQPPYAHMNERCASLPPDYYREPGC
eukprot:TRINITY_DN23901_c0_g1_i1.p1 TRINITY_DN23901_c0_g1~~TRINITY_DN23901_c0_g1_i1.p1  ORF type:complete len:537 (+),score=80.28 TRINITY_DN23901_c0_g1_i1:414-2024(+)